MQFGMYQRRDQDGMFVLVPMLQSPSAEAQEKHGPLALVGAIDADHGARGIDWSSVKDELDIYGYATLPKQALSRRDAGAKRAPRQS